MVKLVLKQVSKTLGRNPVLKGVNLEVNDGEFVVILGPSGSGKTTILRCIAGLETPDSGEIIMDGKVINDMPPKDRDVAMVFQSYALYPTMTVRDNIAFPLLVRHIPKDKIESQVKEVAKLLGIDHLLDRKPGQLSGGERQRVAFARAIVRKPKIFLLDEPFSNLDAKIRVQARSEIKRLVDDLGVTTVFVTHDQAEAMALADRIAVIDKGIVQQFGPPLEVYNNPRNLMVAGFLGSPSMNFLEGKLFMEENKVGVKLLGGITLYSDHPSEELKQFIGQDVVVGFRPEDATFVHTDQNEVGSLPAEVYTVEPLGAQTVVTLKSISLIKTIMPADLNLKVGDVGVAKVKQGKLFFFDKATGDRLI